MRQQRAAAAEQKRDHLHCRIARIDNRQRQQRPADRAQQRVHRVPQAIEPHHFIGEKFGHSANRRHTQHPRIGEHAEAGEVIGQRHKPAAHRKAGGQHDQI